MAEERLSLTAADAVDAVVRSAAYAVASDAPTEAPTATQPTGPAASGCGETRRILSFGVTDPKLSVVSPAAE